MPFSKFSDILDQCMHDAEERLSQRLDAKRAAAILLVAVVKADGRVDRIEFAEVIDVLSRRFDLAADDVGQLLETASDFSTMEHDLEEFTVLLCNTWSQDERLDLLLSFWEIALADQQIDDRERQLINKLAYLLDLPASVIKTANDQAEQALNS